MVYEFPRCQTYVDDLLEQHRTAPVIQLFQESFHYWLEPIILISYSGRQSPRRKEFHK